MTDFISYSNIRRIEFQPGDSLANCKNIIRFANSCTLLEEVENFPGDLGKNVENVDCWGIFSVCYSLRLTEVNFPYAKMRRVSFPGTDTRRRVPISRLVFHPDSPFDQKAMRIISISNIADSSGKDWWNCSSYCLTSREGRLAKSTSQGIPERRN